MFSHSMHYFLNIFVQRCDLITFLSWLTETAMKYLGLTLEKAENRADFDGWMLITEFKYSNQFLI